VSLSLRAGVDPSEIVDQLRGIGGATQEQTLRPDKALSVPDAFGKLLQRHLDQAAALVASSVATLVPSELVTEDDAGAATVEVVKVHDPGLLCPDCHNATVMDSQGCKQCVTPGCGWSKC
jgi:ribonucleoside-diphosphate reductase alpha chain